MRHEPALDGLRAIAIAMVMLFHARAVFGEGGLIGVDVFFVLSGFLITNLLLTAIEGSGHVDLRTFWFRRVLRLTPALLLTTATYAVVAPWLWPGVAHPLLQVAVPVLYASDFGVALFDVPDVLNHTWSLSVEAHYYLLWPLVLQYAPRIGVRRLLAATAIAYVAATAWRIGCVLHGQGWRAVYFRFDTRLTGLLLGSCIALLRRDPVRLAALRAALPSAAWWLPLLALAVFRFRWGSPDVLVWGIPVVELAASAVLLDVIERPTARIARWLSHRALAWLGTMSYGIYLWHYPVMRFMRDALLWPWWATLIAGGALSIAFAAASFHSVESWARARRSGRTMAAPASPRTMAK